MKTYKKLNAFIFFLFLSQPIFCQNNLVLNSSFENNAICPYGMNHFYCGYWFTGWAPDYFHTCATGTICGVPQNFVGRQYPASGEAYAGLVTHIYGSTSRDFIGSTLTQPLVVGIKYYLSMKVSPAEDLMPTNKIGMRFTYNAPSGIDNFAHLYSQQIISDTANWTTIKGSFIADSAYKHIIIGNFFDDNNIATQGSSIGATSYYYVDDIIVSTDSSMIGTSVEDVSAKNIDMIVSPNPSNTGEFVNVKFNLASDADISLSVYDILGKKVYEDRIEGTTFINYHLTKDFMPGIYSLLINVGEHSGTYKILKQ